MGNQVESPRLLLGPGDHGRELDESVYVASEFEEPWEYELRGGRLVVMSPNSEEHDDAAEPWREHLVVYKLSHRHLVQKVVPEAWVRIGPRDYRIGDLGVYLVGARSAQRRPARAPELMIEILSPGEESHDRDFVAKRHEYHAIKILEYLIVDRPRERLTILRHEPTGYAEETLTIDDTYTTPLLPGLAVRLSEVFA